VVSVLVLFIGVPLIYGAFVFVVLLFSVPVHLVQRPVINNNIFAVKKMISELFGHFNIFSNGFCDLFDGCGRRKFE
jgi:hypothetical protein